MKIDASSFRLMKPELTEMMKNLEVGDILKGRVLEALGKSILIRAASGEIFTAVLQDGANIPEDAAVELVIKDIADGKIFAELKGEDKASDPDIKVSDLLKQLNLPADEKNMEAAKLLLKYKLPLNKETITNITGLQKSIDNLNQSGENRLGLLLSGLNIKDTPIDVLNKLVLSWPADSIPPEINIPENGEREPENFEAASIKQTTAGSVKVGKATEDGRKMTDITRTGDSEIHREAAMYVSTIAKGNKGAELVRALTGLGVEGESDIKEFAAQVEGILSSISSTDMEAITYLVSKGMEITPKNLDMLIKNIENRDVISQFLDKLQNRIKDTNDPVLKTISKSIRKIFLEPRQIQDGKEVSQQLKDMADLGEKLESYLKSSKSYDPEIREALSNLKDCIDFIRNVNQHNNYLQIPLLINENTSAAKLYVFKEGKRNKRIDPADATVVVALDLKNLGHLESMIRVKGKTVDTTFRIEDKSIGTMIEKNIDLLKEPLREKGYYLSPIRIISLEQPFSLLSLEAMINEGGMEKIHFDMRV
ncbi:MAG: flagellar hook-length control protein FliK [Clostridiaceae bacterium]|nr:flagellar hook-length control protein FliK [Clostridiaceae bacterium]